MTDVRLVKAVRELDPGTRALLDLSLRRAIPDEQVARVLEVDVAEIPRRRAQGIAELAEKLEVPGPSELAMLLVALPDLPEAAWGVPHPPGVLRRFPIRIPRAQRAGAYRRAAAAASPLVALAAVIAAILVSNGSEHRAASTLTAGGGGAPQHRPGAAASLAPEPRHVLPSGTAIASAAGPTPADVEASSHEAHHARHAVAHKSSSHSHRAGGSAHMAAVHRHSRPHSAPAHHHAAAPRSTPSPPAPPPAVSVALPSPSHGHGHGHGQGRALGHAKPAPGKAVGHFKSPAQPGQNGQGGKVPPGLAKKK